MGVKDNYRNLLKKLLPPGQALTRSVGTHMDSLFDGFSEEPARLHSRIDDLLDEVNPSTAIELLAGWEAAWGLPDQCTGSLATLAERRAALLAKMTHVGQQTPGFFIRVASTLGYTIVIEEHVGGNPYVWRIISNIITAPVYARAGSARAGDPIRTWGGDMIECTMRRLNPAHLQVLFAYIEADIQPELVSATIWPDGLTVALVFNQALSHGASYSDDDFTVDASLAGDDLSLAYVSGNGTATHLYTIGVQIRVDETVTVDFSGDATSLVRVDDAYLATFSGFAVQNNSEQTEAPPSVVSATIGTSGMNLTLVFSEAMTQGSGYLDTDFNLDAASGGDDIGVTYVSGNGTATYVYAIGKTIRAGETVNMDCNGRPDGLADASGNGLTDVSNFAVTNNSEEDYSDILCWSGLDGTINGATYTASAEDYPPYHNAPITGPVSLVTDVVKVGWSSAMRKTISGQPMPSIKFAIPPNGPFRIGVWHRRSSGANYTQTVMTLRSTADNSQSIRIGVTDTNLRITGSSGNTGWSILLDTPGSFPYSTWIFFEISLDPTLRNIRVYANGNLVVNYTHGSAVPANPYNIVSLEEMNSIGMTDHNDNLIISNDVNRGLYALSLLDVFPGA